MLANYVKTRKIRWKMKGSIKGSLYQPMACLKRRKYHYNLRLILVLYLLLLWFFIVFLSSDDGMTYVYTTHYDSVMTQNDHSSNQSITLNSNMDTVVNVSLKPISDSYFQRSAPQRRKLTVPRPLPSILRGDVESITHFPKEAKIEVSFKKIGRRNCKRPRIMGRLSGEYLTMVNWDHDKYLSSNITHGTESRKWRNKITGYYQVPSPGRYFLEIIGILCNDLMYESDLDSSCLEDPAGHRLTSDDSFINIPHTTIDSTNVHTGYWRWSHSSEPDPLYTRYQCHPDPSRNILGQLSCNESQSLERYKPYKFEWLGKSASPLYEPASSNYTLCVVGKSHARTLMEDIQYWIELKKWKNLKVRLIPVERPSFMTGKTAELINSACNISIVAVGQWSAAGVKMVNDKQSWGVGATKFPAYKEELNAGIQTWKKKGVNFALRNIHYNGLGFTRTGCRAFEHRIPPIIDGYNEIVQRLAEDNNITYINSMDVTYPLWDSSADWSHYKDLDHEEGYYFLKHFFDKN